jgi:hypothetical protein
LRRDTRHAQTQSPRRGIPELVEVLNRRAQFRNGRTNAVEELFACIRERHATRRAVQKTHPEPLLERADRLADGRGGNAQMCRGAGKIRALRNCHKGIQFSKLAAVHGLHIIRLGKVIYSYCPAF